MSFLVSKRISIAFHFSRIRTECGEIRIISPYSVQMRGNTDQKNSEYGYFSRSVYFDMIMNFATAQSISLIVAAIKSCSFLYLAVLLEPFQYYFF